VHTRGPKNEWQEEVEGALEQEMLLNRVKYMIQHYQTRCTTIATNIDDSDDLRFEEEDLEQELQELRKSHKKFKGDQDDYHEDGNVL
jgi:cell division protein FtsB